MRLWARTSLKRGRPAPFGFTWVVSFLLPDHGIWVGERGPHMMIDIPSRGLDKLPDSEQKKLQVPDYRFKAAFQWPADCLWPLMDDAPGTDT